MIRLSATLLQSFYLYQTTEWMTEGELVAHIKGVFVTTPNIELGKAYHAILERPQLSLEGLYERNGYRFTAPAIDRMREQLGPGLFEVKTTKKLGPTREGDDVVLVAKCDHIHGSHISEVKTTGDSFDAEKYLQSIQWKVMALLFEAHQVTYHVALLQSGEGVYGLRDIASLNVFAYPELERDVRALVREFMHFVRLKGLDSYLRKEVPKSCNSVWTATRHRRNTQDRKEK